MPVAKLRLAHLPTPLWRHDALDALVGAEVWVKRDDMSAGPAAGNKIRKLEYLLADAKARATHTVVTCGGLQSNHARATALLCRQLDMDTLLLLRSDASQLPEPLLGNVFLDRLAGARITLITPRQYRDRSALMDDAAARLEARGLRAYVIPEGGSNGLGALGYVDAMAELRGQLDAGECDAPSSFDAVVHACGSGGTAAGLALGNAHFAIAQRVIAVAVCDDEAYFSAVTARVIAEAQSLLAGPCRPTPLEIVDRFKGPAYGIASEAQARFIVEVARRTGLILDPVYTGKALFGLANLSDKPRRALFVHTGGLPGLLAQSAQLHAYLT